VCILTQPLQRNRLSKPEPTSPQTLLPLLLLPLSLAVLPLHSKGYVITLITLTADAVVTSRQGGIVVKDYVIIVICVEGYVIVVIGSCCVISFCFVVVIGKKKLPATT
jgi:hypothetical protein